jgi:hypothetical protein
LEKVQARGFVTGLVIGNGFLRETHEGWWKGGVCLPGVLRARTVEAANDIE